MLSQDDMVPAQTEWVAVILFAPEKGGSLRFCVDHKTLNHLTRRGSYPMQRMDKGINSLEKATLFSTLDANSE